ncbi:MAG: hypothetical protein M1503_04940 [Thaumarchaeota archaeon]|nr:hypothetical protein [Nitrososphaerota archaeon]MCL5317598.1 hypothetical protein [Nitrososphaerota archaeon]
MVQSSSPSFLDRSESVSVTGRSFKLRLMSLANGCFLLVSEGSEERFGSLTLSMKIGERVEHTSMTPDMRAGVFAGVLADLAASLCPGITIVSLYVREEMRPETASDLLKRIRDFINAARTSS